MKGSDPAGVRSQSAGEDEYFGWSRPELRALVPPTARRVLDVGCGAGAFGGALRDERGIEVIGVELVEDAAALARQRLDDVIVADLDTLTELPCARGSFDAIVCGDVLEHLRDPERLLRVLRPYLAPDGVLVCSVPNVKHWSVVLPLLAWDRWPYDDAGLLDRTHVHFFTLDELELTLTEAGFEAVGVTPVVERSEHDIGVLADVAARFGGDRDETLARLDAYQYAVVARHAAGAARVEQAPAADATRGAVAVAATPAVAVPSAPAPSPEQPATAETSPVPAASLLVVLDGGAHRALRCLESIAALTADQPAHEIVIVDNASADLAPLLARLDGDVAVMRTPRREGLVAATRRGLARCRADAVVLLRGAPLLEPGALAPLLAALADPACAAATAASAPGADSSPVATHALAARRADLDVALEHVPATTPPGLELAAVCLALSARGHVQPVAGSVAAPPGARDGGLRRAPGEEVELSIVIPTLDAASERVRRCVAAAQATTDAAHEIVVLDNGAPPQGFTAPVNAGLRAARGRYLLVLNDDVELLPGWWPPLRAALDAGAAVVFPDTIDGPMRHDFAAWCFALTRDTLEEFSVADGEFLDPELVVWFQDTDLLERLRHAGRPPQHVPASQIRHGLSETVMSEDPQLRAWIAERVQVDQRRFHAKHGADVAGAAR